MKKYPGNRKAQRRRRRLLAKKFRIEWILKNSPCKCGSTERLQVDHIDPSKKSTKLKRRKYNTNRIWMWGKESRERELMLCQALCHKCHVEKSTLEQRRLPLHSRAGYWRGCRCQICRNGKNEYKKQLRLKRRGVITATR